MLWPPVRFSFDTVNYELASPAPSPPTRENWLGTDDQGRDVLARAIYGFRISVLFGLALTLASTVIGVLAGAVQGYFGGWVDLGLQRFIEVWSSLPELYLLMILASVVEPNFGWLLLIMLLFSWMALVGVVRAEFLRARNFEYVRAARALGVGDLTIMLRHVLPNAMVASLTFLPFILNGSIVTLTSLDFLGFGMPPGSPSLGELVAQGKANLHAPGSASPPSRCWRCSSPCSSSSSKGSATPSTPARPASPDPHPPRFVRDPLTECGARTDPAPCYIP